MKISRKTQFAAIKLGRPTDKEKRKRSPRFLFCFPPGQRAKVDEIITWYRTTLKVRASVSFVIRTALDEFYQREKARIGKTEKGRFHAKVR